MEIAFALARPVPVPDAPAASARSPMPGSVPVMSTRVADPLEDRPFIA
jgi:hypothetical protein